MKPEIRPRRLSAECDEIMAAIDRLLPPQEVPGQQAMFEVVGVYVYNWEDE